MKKSIWIICALIIAQNVPAQRVPAYNEEFYNYLDKKSKNQKLTANILMISGALLTTTGFMIGFANAAPDGSDQAMGAAGAAMGVGFLSMVTSIPFYISSSVKRQKARELQVSAGFERLENLTVNARQPAYYPAMRLQIKIR